MNSRGKSTDSRTASDSRHWSEDLARLHCLQALFPDWIDNDPFLIRQIKESIEASMRQQPGIEDSFEAFSAMARSLRSGSPSPFPESHAFICLDYTGQRWDPLFRRQEIVDRLKPLAGTDQIFLLVKGLPTALFPRARYRTRKRQQAIREATRLIDQLALEWSTSSSQVHILYT